MNAEIQQLLLLQRIDDDIDRIKAEQAAIPQHIASVEDKIRESESICTQEKEKLAGLNKRRLSLENDVVLLNERLKKYQLQLYSAKTNEEYHAFLREIEVAKKGVSQNEEDILVLMEDADNMTSDIAKRTAELGKEKAAAGREIDSLKERLSELNEEFRKKTGQRDGLAAEMDRHLVTKYERIKNGRGGTAVAVITGEVCSGCHSTLPPQFAVEIRRGEDIIICENCGRILVWEGKD
jgi:hypothetical protein